MDTVSLSSREDTKVEKAFCNRGSLSSAAIDPDTSRRKTRLLAPFSRMGSVARPKTIK